MTNPDSTTPTEQNAVPSAQAMGSPFYCDKHKYNPPENSGFCLCPWCELDALHVPFDAPNRRAHFEQNERWNAFHDGLDSTEVQAAIARARDKALASIKARKANEKLSDCAPSQSSELARSDAGRSSLHRSVRLPLVREMLRCRSHERMCRWQRLPAAEQAWRMRRWGIAWALKTLRQPNDRTERRGTATPENQKPYGTT